MCDLDEVINTFLKHNTREFASEFNMIKVFKNKELIYQITLTDHQDAQPYTHNASDIEVLRKQLKDNIQFSLFDGALSCEHDTDASCEQWYSEPAVNSLLNQIRNSYFVIPVDQNYINHQREAIESAGEATGVFLAALNVTPLTAGLSYALKKAIAQRMYAAFLARGGAALAGLTLPQAIAATYPLGVEVDDIIVIDGGEWSLYRNNIKIKGTGPDVYNPGSQGSSPSGGSGNGSNGAPPENIGGAGYIFSPQVSVLCTVTQSGFAGPYANGWFPPRVTCYVGIA